MYSSSIANLLTLGLLAASPLVSAHGMITFASGDQGGTGIGLGVTSTTSNSESDTTVFRKNAGAFGETSGSGTIDPATQLSAAQAVAGDTLPQVSSGGTVTMTYHQINQDGAGPVKCAVSADGTGNDFTPMTMTGNVPGNFGVTLTKDTNFPIAAQMPAGMTCTGTIGSATNACVVQCKNPIGPFGSNVVVQMAGAAATTTGNSTTTAAVAPAAAPAVAPAVAPAAGPADGAAAGTGAAGAGGKLSGLLGGLGGGQFGGLKRKSLRSGGFRFARDANVRA